MVSKPSPQEKNNRVKAGYHLEENYKSLSRDSIAAQDEELDAVAFPQALPMPEDYQYYVDMSSRTFWLCGDIDSSSLLVARAILAINVEDAGIEAVKRKPIRILINSCGGDASVMWTLVDTIASSKTPVLTVNIGEAYSAASIIFVAGHLRYATPHSWFMIHSGSAGFADSFDNVVAFNRKWAQDVLASIDFLTTHTNISQSTYESHAKSDWYFDAKEAVSLGIADKIIESLDEIITG